MNEAEQALERELVGKGKTAPRITGDHIDACIVGQAIHRIPGTLATHCILALYNGWTIHATNAGPVSPENFDPDIGERLAIKAARDQIWQLEGYLLADRLHRAAGGAPVPAYGGIDTDPVHAMAAGTAFELLRSKGYAYDEEQGAWLRGDEAFGNADLVDPDAPYGRRPDGTPVQVYSDEQAAQQAYAEAPPLPEGFTPTELHGQLPSVEPQGEYAGDAPAPVDTTPSNPVNQQTGD